MIPESECDVIWDYNNHGDDWMCKCITGNKQSPIDLPDNKKVIDYYERIGKKLYSSVPEALECLRQHCSNSFKTLVKIINLNSRYEKDEVT